MLDLGGALAFANRAYRKNRKKSRAPPVLSNTSTWGPRRIQARFALRPGRTTLFVLPMGREAAQPYLED